MTVRPSNPADWPAVQAIYAAGIATGDATFETEPPTWDQFDSTRLPQHRLVAVDPDNTITGWAAVCPVSDHCADAGVVEHSVYVDPTRHGQGIGRALLQHLISSTEAAGSGPSNPASSPRTPPASPSTNAAVSASSAAANA